MSDKARCLLGMIFGISMGMAYGLISQYINVLTMPDIPIYQPAPGRLGSTVLLVIFGGLMGLAVAWPMDAIPGVILGAFFATLAQIILSVKMQASIPGNVVGFTYIVILTFLPRVVIALPITGLIRWILDLWEREIAQVTFSVRKLGLSYLALIFVSSLAGLLSLYPSQGRLALLKTNQLIQSGLQSASSDQLPQALEPVDGFSQSAHGAYTLQLTNNPDELPIQRPFASYQAEEYAVFVRFENGYRLGCVFVPPHPEPYCGIY